MILAGCGGEWWYGRDAAAIAGELQTRASVKIATLSKDTAALEKEAAEAKFAALKAQLNLAEIETQRTVTRQQRTVILSMLASAPKGAVSVTYPITDGTDAQPFAASIEHTLTEAGYTLVAPPDKLRGMLSWSAPGAYLVVHDLKRAPSYAAAIQRAFGKAGIFLIGVPKPTDVPPNAVVIVVASHPFSIQSVPAQLR